MESRSQFAREAHRVWASALFPGPEQSLLKAFCHPSKHLFQARPTDLPDTSKCLHQHVLQAPRGPPGHS